MICPSSAILLSLACAEGAGKAERRRHPYIPCAEAHGHPVCRSTRASTTGTARTSRLSPRDGLTAYTYSPRGAAFLAPVTGGKLRKRSARVAAPGPHDFAGRYRRFAG